MNHKKVWIRSLIITIALWIVFAAVSLFLNIFVVLCKTCVQGFECYCPSELGLLLKFSSFAVPICFIIILGINYLVEWLRKK